MTEQIDVCITSQKQRWPQYETPGSAGMDLAADLAEEVTIRPGTWALIPTGVSIALPEGYEAQIRARSGLAVRYGIALVNGVGTIDSDYRGEIKVALMNHGPDSFTVKDGDRIAQMVVASYTKVHWKPVPVLESTKRGSGGFGHTGVAVTERSDGGCSE